MLSKRVKLCFVLIIAFFLLAVSPAYSAIEWNIQKTLKTDSAPLDVTVSQNGRSIFILTEEGNVLIYDREGTLTDTIKVGTHVDQIRIGPRDELLFATSRQNKSVEVIELDYIYTIDTAGSPFKGPQDAPVVLTVFSDFQ